MRRAANYRYVGRLTLAAIDEQSGRLFSARNERTGEQ